MSSEHKHSVFDSSHQLSEQEIKDYHSGKLSSVEMHRIERIAENNPLSAAALEGLKGADYSENISSIRKTVEFKSGIRFNFFQKSVFILGAAAIVALIAVWFNENKIRVSDNNASSNALEINTESTVEDDFENITIEQADSEKVILKSERSDTSLSLTFSSNAKKIDVSNENYVTYAVLDSIINIPLNIISPAKALDSSLAESEKEIKKIKLENSQAIYHIEDYKVVDYRGLREEPFTQLNNSLGGTSAQYANQEEQKNNPESTGIIQVAYVEYLDEAILLFSKGKNKEANKKFNKILKKYPEDANALFYKGMSEYRMNNYTKASRLFWDSFNNHIKTFSQESEYYLALSTYKKGNIEESVIVLNSIIEKEGFYAVQARNYLAEID